MAKSKPLPNELAVHVPSGDTSQPWEQLEDGRTVVAGRHALILLDEEGVVDSGLWHEVQFARWSLENRTLTVVWAQPDRSPIMVQTITDDPQRLMEAITMRVDKTIVATRSFFAENGTRVSATVRRRPDGELFSILIADGPLAEEDRHKADDTESSLRSELGMDD